MLHERTDVIGERNGLRLKKAQVPIRVAVTGSTVSPPLPESLELLGRDRTVVRMKAVA